jgi:hypothetical protein
LTASQHPFDAAERKATKRDPLEAELVEELEEISPEVVDRGGPGHDGRAPMPTPVVAHDPEALCERGCRRTRILV